MKTIAQRVTVAACVSTLLVTYLLTPAVLVAQTDTGFAEPTLVVRDFGYDAGTWRLDKHVRTLADVNGDGKADIVGFGDRGVIVALATDTGFAEPTLVVRDFAYDAGTWRLDKHVRTLADVNGDGKADIVGFGDRGVIVALATDTGFAEPTLVVRDFAYDAGTWRLDKHVRTLADVNGDGKADIVGFGDKGVTVALATDTGFAEPTLVVRDFAYDAGTWRLDKHVRILADVNGDGKADIVGFGDKGVTVALATDTGFAEPTLVVRDFAYDAGTWRLDKHVRTLADVNGDGKADIVGFGDRGVIVALATDTGFAEPTLVVRDFAYDAGTWRLDKHVRTLADVNGDGKADIVGFGDRGVIVALATETGFAEPSLVVRNFGYNNDAGTWRLDKHVRTLADINGDGKADIVGFGDRGVIVALATDSSSKAIVTYQPTDELFANPERGFYQHEERIALKYSPLDASTLRGYRENEQITLILRLFYLNEFLNSDLSQRYLDLIEADFTAIRQAGLKAVVRFAYANKNAPPRDADKARILGHVRQLAPILSRHSDVIVVVQAGFIGVWGEWYYTDHFVADPSSPGNVSDFYYGERGDVFAAILDTLPADRMVQVRTPLIKQKIYGTGTGAASALPPGNAYDGSDIARTGHHNDCFLASSSDFGTYSDIVQDKAYLAEETKYLPIGGETCNDTTDDDDPKTPTVDESSDRSLCPTALTELKQFHWSYLNFDYHKKNGTSILVPGVLDKWETGTTYKGVSYGPCMDEIKRKLGYRFTLVEGTYPNEVQSGDSFDIQIKLRNDGWAAPFNPRLVELLLRHQVTGEIHRISLPDDPRLWLADNATIYSIVHTVAIPATLPPGNYDLLLNLPDPRPSLADPLADPLAYAIRLANASVWEETTGYNDLLHTVTIKNVLPVVDPIRNTPISLHLFLPLVNR